MKQCASQGVSAQGLKGHQASSAFAQRAGSAKAPSPAVVSCALVPAHAMCDQASTAPIDEIIVWKESATWRASERWVHSRLLLRLQSEPCFQGFDHRGTLPASLDSRSLLL